MRLKGLSDKSLKRVASVIAGSYDTLYINGPALGSEVYVGTLEQWAELLRELPWYDEYLDEHGLDSSEFSYEEWVESLVGEYDALRRATDEEIAEFTSL